MNLDDLIREIVREEINPVAEQLDRIERRIDDLDARPVNVAPCPLLSPGDVARYLGVSKRTVQRMATAGQLPTSIQFGSARRWRMADLESWSGAP